MTADAFHWLFVGFFAPRIRHHEYSIEPAIRKRAAPIPNGGIVSTPQWIARYVDPHTR